MKNARFELDKVIEKNIVDNKRPRLLLHSCCAPCSSYVLEYLHVYFDITVFYYNPNIFPESEMILRINEQEQFIEKLNQEFFLGEKKENNNLLDEGEKIKFIKGPYEKEKFYELAKGLEEEKEKGRRCLNCYKLRLEKTASLAKEQGFDYFTTTLSISPLKDAKVINDIGIQLQNEFQVNWLPSDFKKKNGYKRSVELSKQFGLYRQNYCGCEFSLENKS